MYYFGVLSLFVRAKKNFHYRGGLEGLAQHAKCTRDGHIAGGGSQHKNWGFTPLVDQHFGGRAGIHDGHTQIHEDHVDALKPIVIEEFNCLPTSVRTHQSPAQLSEPPGQRLVHDVTVVDQQHFQRLGLARFETLEILPNNLGRALKKAYTWYQIVRIKPHVMA